MRNALTWMPGGLLVVMLTAPGCASRPNVVAECPRYVPSPEALKPIEGTGWAPLARRVVETYSTPSSEP